MKKKRKAKLKIEKGFTLIEVMISIAILGIVAALAYQMLSGGQNMWSQDLALVELQQKARQSLQRMSKEIREGTSVEITEEGQRISFIDPDGSNISYYYLAAELIEDSQSQGGRIKRSSDASSDIVIADNIESLLLNWASSDENSVKIKIEGKKEGQGARRELVFSLDTEVTLRNE